MTSAIGSSWTSRIAAASAEGTRAEAGTSRTTEGSGRRPPGRPGRPPAAASRAATRRSAWAEAALPGCGDNRIDSVQGLGAPRRVAGEPVLAADGSKCDIIRPPEHQRCRGSKRQGQSPGIFVSGVRLLASSFRFFAMRRDSRTCLRGTTCSRSSYMTRRTPLTDMLGTTERTSHETGCQISRST